MYTFWESVWTWCLTDMSNLYMNFYQSSTKCDISVFYKLSVMCHITFCYNGWIMHYKCFILYYLILLNNYHHYIWRQVLLKFKDNSNKCHNSIGVCTWQFLCCSNCSWSQWIIELLPLLTLYHGAQDPKSSHNVLALMDHNL